MKPDRWIGMVVFTMAAALAIALPLPAAAAADGPGLFLWKATAEGATVHLLGTIHLARPELYPLDPAIESAFEAAPVLVVEVNLNDLDPDEIGLEFARLGILPPGTGIDSLVSADTLQAVNAYLEGRGLPAEQFRQMRPWMLALRIGVVELQRLGFDPELGIDQHFLKAAAAMDKEVRGLESARFQIELFSGFSNELQELFLQYTLRDVEKLEAVMDDLLGAWKSGDAAALENLLLDAEDRNGPLRPIYEKLFFERNVRMAAQIGELLRAGGEYFVAVGSGHLVGEDGIIELLEKEDGVTIEQVKK